MTPADLRRLALSMPEAAESSHLGQVDFRVRGKIFATLSEAEGCGVLKITPDQQEVMCSAEPTVFAPVTGAWGRKGWTRIQLAPCDPATLNGALNTAWRNVAPKRLALAAAATTAPSSVRE